MATDPLRIIRWIHILHIAAIVVVVGTLVLVILRAAPQDIEPPSSDKADAHVRNAQHLQVHIDSLNRVNAELSKVSSLYADSLRNIDERYTKHRNRVRNASADDLRAILDSLSATYLINRERYHLLLQGGIEIGD
jgi:hypothetical protein